MSETPHSTADEAAIGQLVESWAGAVRSKDLPGILDRHSPNLLMFDVPPPLQLQGLDAYAKSWDLFFAWSPDPVVFQITEMSITAGSDIAFVAALMRCAVREATGEYADLDFRLTIGLRKTDGQWMVTHEHHSIPAP
jgi:uncharacterized protein (TIGR02246 family)